MGGAREIVLSQGGGQDEEGEEGGPSPPCNISFVFPLSFFLSYSFRADLVRRGRESPATTAW